MWIELLLALAAGGATGWIAHKMAAKRPAIEPAPPDTPLIPSPEGRERIAEMDAQLKAAEAEIGDLRRRSGIMPADFSGQPPEGSLAWRNRILESRVRFLEGKLADLETDGLTAERPEEQNDEATRLRWRNRYLEGRVKYLEEELVKTGGLSPGSTIIAAIAQADAQATQSAMPPDEDKPELIEAPRGGRADDLKMISGIGPKLEQKLNSMGVWHWSQIAAWTPKETGWVNAAIGFRGRIERERWAGQAKSLLEQGSTGNFERTPESNGA